MSSPRERILVTLLREIAAEQGYRFTSFSQDWILRLARQDQARYVFGFNFEINSATALSLAGDKAAVAVLLADQGVAHIEHRFFLNPSRAAYVPDHGHWPAILAYAEAQHYQLVAKPNDGTGGLGVTHVQTQAQLERAVQTIFQRGQSLSLSPFYPIDNEFRLVMLDAECQLAYSKQRPALHGDGHSHLRSLLAAALLSGQISQAQASEALEQHQGQLERVLAAGESLTISWKHNLGAGATPRPLAAGPQLAALTQLAQAAAQAINIRFASIDIVEVSGELRVLEVNSGIMMEHFARHRPENRAQAKAIYARAVEKMFAPH